MRYDPGIPGYGHEGSSFFAGSPIRGPEFLSIGVLDAQWTGGEFSVIAHTVGCCACGEIHDAGTLALKQSIASAEGPSPISAATPGPIFAGDIPGDTSSTATLAVGGTVVDTIEVSGDQDWFKVTLVAGTRYHITLSGSGDDPLDDPYLEIMDALGNQIKFDDDSGGDFNSATYFVPSTSGTYFINAHGWVNENDGGTTSTGQYTLTLEEAPPLEAYSFDQIASFLTNGYWSQRAWSDLTIDVNITALSVPQQTLARAALATWASMTPLVFTEVDVGGQIVFTSDDPEEPNTQDAHASSTISGGTVIISSTINISDNWFGGDTTLDSYTFQTYLHEIGHALGLGHAGPYNSTADYGEDNIYTNDNWSHTVMSYFDQLEAGWGNYRFALGPQIADILAIQSLYGANPNGTRTGNTTYGFNSTESDINDWSQFVVVQPEGTYRRPPSYAIYDTGGTDTIDLSGFSRDQELNLNPETFSSLGDRPDNSDPTYTNIVSIMRGTIIENAIGGSGGDTITGNTANNTITLGGSADTFVYLQNGGQDTVTDFSVAQDTLDLQDLSGTVATNAFNNRTSVNGGTLLTFSSGQSIFLAGIQTNQLTLSNLIIAAEPPSGPTEGDDVLTGTSGDDTISALGGNDEVSGLGGNDTLNGDAGNDTLLGGDGNDLLQGGTGADSLHGGNGFDTADYTDATGAVEIRLWNGTGTGDVAEGDTLVNIEAVLGGSGNDFIAGNSGNNTLTGNGGNDFLVGNEGNDALRGGEGNDTLRGGAGADSLQGGGGFDTADYTDATGAVEIRLWNGTGTGDIAEGDTLSLIEAVLGGSGNDFIAGNESNNTLSGNHGADYLIGNGGNDTLRGGEGNDTLRGGTGADTLDGGGGFDTADYSDATGRVEIRLWNGTGIGDIAEGDTLSLIEAVQGGSSNDFIAGNESNNTLSGNYGADFLVGNGGNDTLRGGEGNDSLRGGAGADTLDGGGGFDTVDYTDATGRVEIRLWNGTGIGDIAQGDTFNLIEAVIGGLGDDLIAGNSGNNTLTGGAGSDVLIGNEGNDALRGGDGNDTLRGGAGNDILSGHAGADRFEYDSGADTILDFSTSSGDTIDLTAFTSVNDLSELQAFYSQSGPNAVFDFGGGNTLTVNNKMWADFSADDFIFASAAESLSSPSGPKAASTQMAGLDVLDARMFDFSGLDETTHDGQAGTLHDLAVIAVFEVAGRIDTTDPFEPSHQDVFVFDDNGMPDLAQHDWFEA